MDLNTSILPPWRCAACTRLRQLATIRILELSRTTAENRMMMALVEHMGYPRWEMIEAASLMDESNTLTEPSKQRISKE
jgi:hypothetical protein